MVSNRMVIYVSSPKSYKDVFDIFYLCFKKNWHNSPYPLILSTNYNANYEDVEVYSSHNLNDSWIERSIPVLKSLSCKYIMMLCDDIFIKEEVNNDVLEHILDVMDKYGCNFCRLQPIHNGKLIEGEVFLSWTPKKTPYAINLLRGIYNREFLLQLLGDGSKSIWELEGEWLKNNTLIDSGFYNDLITCNREVMPIIHGVMKGSFMPSSIRRLKKMGINVESNRHVMSWFKEIYYDIYCHIGYILSPSTRYFVKKIMKFLGFKIINAY